ncbi:DNA/RNA non-specific endonuclease [Mesorhizobium sp. WSM2239]|uniref:DNA/RNA non-specific endonuclease n=2 Tax=unclassified Mesorhizobium TaxID=325217 RepID=A0AAU8D4N0_9HYPH
MGDRFHFSRQIIDAAADRWEATKPEREKRARAKAEGRYDEVDSKERIVKHANRLRQQLRAPLESIASEAKAALPARVRELAERKPVTKANIDALFVERVIGPTKDFLSAEFFDLGSLAMRSVARIRTELGGGVSYGTGFMVTPSLLLTNEHVLESAEWAAASVAEFDYQRDRLGKGKPVQSFHLDPDRFFLNDKALDFALVAVRPAPGVGNARLADFGFCPLVGVEGKILVTDPVNIVQHPQGRMKEVVIRENELSALPLGDLDGFAHYLGDTEPGSSGSPVFNDRWEVVALHHSSVPARDGAGNYLTRDGTVWDEDSMPVEEIAWVGNEGIRISRIINRLKQVTNLPAAKAALLKQLLEKSDTTEMGPLHEEGAKPDRSSADVCAVDLSGTATITVPVTITVEVGGARAVRAELGQTAAAERVRPAPDYEGRPGFDVGFLGVAVPMPDLVDRRHGEPAMLADGSGELKYHHFSVLMNADRRLAYVSAVNYDASAPFVEERGNDDWFIDPRIDAGAQADNRFYKNNPLDRGHLARRYDAGWGMTAEEAKLANDDTFHWTNCAPQHEVFNQSKLSQPKDLRLWGELENHITDQAKQDMQRLSIFNGPVFGKDDRTHRGLLIPSAFWKVVAYRSREDGLRAVGFVLHQTDLISNLAAERFDVGRFDLRQVRISRIEELTGLDFKGLRNVDPMAATGVREVFEGAVAAERKLTSAADIRF